MADTEHSVTPLPRPLPEKIAVPTSLTPNEMRALKAQTGKPLEQLLGGDADDMELAPDRLQAMVWCALRRAGYSDVTWDQAGDVAADTEDVAPDPSKSGS